MDTPMRLCIVGRSSSEHVLRWARAFVPRGHEVHIVSVSGGVVPGATLHRLGWGAGSLPRRLASYARMAASLRRLLGELRPDLVQAHFAYTHGAIAARTRFHPLMLVLLGSDVLLPRLRDRLARPLSAYAVRRADLIVAEAPAPIEATRALGATCPIQMLHFGVDLGWFVPRVPRGKGEAPRLGIFKALFPLYGHRDLIEAFALTVEAHRDAQLVVAGEGPLRRELERRAVALGIRRNVEFLGAVPHARVPEVMATLDAVVLASHSEGVPNMLLEACAMGLPCVATRVGGVPQVVADGATGFLVPPGDVGALAAAMVRLCGDRALRRRMGEAARAHVEAHYDCRASVDRMERICLELVERVRGAGG
jgi:glycosyltransferase involved in cell wall biosynthesis